MSPSPKKMLLILTGSISCYKICNLISKWVQNKDFTIQVVATENSLKFIGAVTLEALTGRQVLSDLWQGGQAMQHIQLVRWADLILVAPASANYLSQIAHGLATDLATNLFLAHDFKKPFLIAPAMNSSMYLHPAIQDSVEKILMFHKIGAHKINSDRDKIQNQDFNELIPVQLIPPDSGMLACGEYGTGRLAELTRIEDEVFKALVKKKKICSQKILITAGGTQEPLDEVRLLTNISTGKTASILAEELIQRGHDVTFVHASNSVLPQLDCKKLKFKTFSDLNKILVQELHEKQYDGVIHAAAVGDFSASKKMERKISSEKDLVLKLKRNPKIVDQIKKISSKKKIKLVAFKLTAKATEDEVLKSIEKLRKNSNADLIVHNDTSKISGNNHWFQIFLKDKGVVQMNGKNELARFIGEYFVVKKTQ